MEQSGKKTICLNMIVKNESHIIIETLKNLCSYIDFSYWVISDTGSTDNTKELIIDFFKNNIFVQYKIVNPFLNNGIRINFQKFFKIFQFSPCDWFFTSNISNKYFRDDSIGYKELSPAFFFTRGCMNVNGIMFPGVEID